MHFPRRDVLEVLCDDLPGCAVQLFAVFVEDDCVGIAVEDLEGQLGRVFVVDFCERFGQDGPRVVKVVVIQNSLSQTRVSAILGGQSGGEEALPSLGLLISSLLLHSSWAQRDFTARLLRC